MKIQRFTLCRFRSHISFSFDFFFIFYFRSFISFSVSACIFIASVRYKINKFGKFVYVHAVNFVYFVQIKYEMSATEPSYVSSCSCPSPFECVRSSQRVNRVFIIGSVCLSTNTFASMYFERWHYQCQRQILALVWWSWLETCYRFSVTKIKTFSIISHLQHFVDVLVCVRCLDICLSLLFGSARSHKNHLAFPACWFFFPLTWFFGVSTRSTINLSKNYIMNLFCYDTWICAKTQSFYRSEKKTTSKCF